MSMESHLRILSLAMFLLAAGCGLMSYEAKPLTPSRSANAFVDRRLDPSARTERALVDDVLAMHPDVVLAKAKVATALAAVGTANTRPNPTAGFQPDIASNPGGAASPWALGFTLDVPFETADKRSRRVDVARSSVQVAALDAASVSFQTASAVRHAFRELAAASERVELLTKQRQAQEEVVKLLDARVTAGDMARAETTQSRLLLQQTQIAARDAEKKHAEARATLAAAAGVPVEAVSRASFDFSTFDQAPTAPSVGQARRRAMNDRTDLLSTLAAYAAAEAALRLEIAKQYPDIHLSPGYQYDQGTHKWSLPGLSTALPIFDRNRGPIMEALAKRAEVGAAFLALQAKVVGEVDHALASLNGSRVKLAETERLLAEHRGLEESLAARQKAGAADKLALATAIVERHAAEISRLDALAEVQQAALDLDRATQTP